MLKVKVDYKRRPKITPRPLIQTLSNCFPKVAVHIDDQDLIKRLPDKTNAIIFAGLVFTDYIGKLVNIAW